MTTVALETSTRAPSVAVRRPDGEPRERPLGPGAHASGLLPALEALLCAEGLAPRSITAVLVGTGPGSYTGLRVGIATAQGLARATGARLVGVPSTEVLAYGALAPGEEGVVLIDARQGELYYAQYRRLESEVETVVAPRVVGSAEVQSLLPAAIPIFARADAVQAAGLPPDAGGRARDCAVRASSLLELGSARLESRGGMSLDDVQPLYLRPFRTSVAKR